MRFPTADEEKILAAPGRRAFVRVLVADSGGTFRDLTTYPELNFVQGVEWNEAIDDAVSTATVTLRRAIGSRSLAPLDALSPLNLAFNPAGTYAPLLQVGRQMKIEAGVAVDGSTAPAVWNLAFHGYIDAIDWPGDDVVLECSGLEGKLRDVWIETERVYAYAQGAYATAGVRAWYPGLSVIGAGELVIPSQARLNGHFYRCTGGGNTDPTEPPWLTGSGSARSEDAGSVEWTESGTTSTTTGTAVETVIQQILNDNLGAGVVTLYTPTSPGWAVRFFAQRREPLLTAIQSLAEQIGWALRYRFDSGTGTFRLTLFDPDRTKTLPDRVFEPSQILEVSRCRVEIAEIRNAIRVVYPNAADVDPKGVPLRATLDVTDATSITKYGRRFMEIAEDDASNINTTAEASTLANNALSDLKEPTAEYGVQLGFFPFVQTCDLIRFMADVLHFTATQDLAIVSISHSFTEDGAASTSITTRGKPSLGVDTWLRRDAGGRGTHQSTLHSSGEPFVAVSDTTVGGTQLGVTQGTTPHLSGYVQNFETHIGNDPDFTPSSGTLVSAGAADNSVINVLVPGRGYYAKMVPYTFNGSKHVRGLPSEAIAFTAGRTKAAHYDSLVSQGHFPLNGNFEHASDDLTSRPFDHWAVTAGTWGSSGDLYWGNDATFGNYVALRQTGGDPGLRSSAFPVRRAGGHFNLYLSVRPQGTLVAGRGLQVYVRFYRKADLSDSPILFTKNIPYNVAAANVWAGYTVNSEFIGALPYDVNFCTIAFGKESVSSAYGFDIGDIFFSEAEQYDLWCQRLFVQGTLYGSGTGGSASLYQPAWTAVTFQNSFADYAGGWLTTAYMKDSLGFVHLRGLVARASAALATNIFTLPSGYRPSSSIMFCVNGANRMARLDIDSSGGVRVEAADDAGWYQYVSLNGITFDTR